MNVFPSILPGGINKIIEEYCHIAFPFEKELLHLFRYNFLSIDSYWFYDKKTVRIEDGFTSKEKYVINRADEGKYLYLSVYDTNI